MRSEFLNADNSFEMPTEDNKRLSKDLDEILKADFSGNMFQMLSKYQSICADSKQRNIWDIVVEKLHTLFMCGKAVPLDGPMIGIPVVIRDSDYFKKAANLIGEKRSLATKIELFATTWNSTFVDTGFWMGKTFEAISKDAVINKTNNYPKVVEAYNPETTRIGRNFFRDPPDPKGIQKIGIPALIGMWGLRDRPTLENPDIFDTKLIPENFKKEVNIPYSKTGGIFLADNGTSVVPEMKGKEVYQLNYRWPQFKPVYPLSQLVDEIVQIGEGIYLGQLVFATKRYSLVTIDPDSSVLQLGEDYNPGKHSFFDKLISFFSPQKSHDEIDYGYQNNGYFLMMDPAYAKQIYAVNAFPQLRPRAGESGYTESENVNK
ncbi:MAG: hypothetical protein GY775_20940 [Candidatus Scalindua sp.]|nr:hypothetical protein [Candidatus Scalindua sp.]